MSLDVLTARDIASALSAFVAIACWPVAYLFIRTIRRAWRQDPLPPKFWVALGVCLSFVGVGLGRGYFIARRALRDMGMIDAQGWMDSWLYVATFLPLVAGILILLRVVTVERFGWRFYLVLTALLIVGSMVIGFWMPTLFIRPGAL